MVQVSQPPSAGGQGGSVRMERRPLADLKPAVYNPRAISPRALEGLGASVREFGLVQPIVWNRLTGNVVGGHQRLKALELQGVAETDVVVVELDDARERALNLALNSPAISGEFTAAALPMVEDLLRTLPELASAVNLPQLHAYLRTTVRQPLPEVEPEAPEPPAEPVTQPGDVWRLGAHRLVCGDSREPAVLRLATEGALAECLWTDPPYGVAYVGGTERALSIANDAPEDLGPLLGAALPAIDGVLAPLARFYVAAPAGPQGTVFRNAIAAAGWRLHQVLVWAKDSLVLGHSDYHYRHEDLLYGWKPGQGRPGRGRGGGHRRGDRGARAHHCGPGRKGAADRHRAAHAQGGGLRPGAPGHSGRHHEQAAGLRVRGAGFLGHDRRRRGAGRAPGRRWGGVASALRRGHAAGWGAPGVRRAGARLRATTGGALVRKCLQCLSRRVRAHFTRMTLRKFACWLGVFVLALLVCTVGAHVYAADETPLARWEAWTGFVAGVGAAALTLMHHARVKFVEGREQLTAMLRSVQMQLESLNSRSAPRDWVQLASQRLTLKHTWARTLDLASVYGPASAIDELTASQIDVFLHPDLHGNPELSKCLTELCPMVGAAADRVENART